MPTLAAALVFAAAGLAPPPPALQTWWHDQAERQAQGPVAFGAVRQSGTFSASVISDTPRWWEQQRSQTGVPGWERSFVYQSIPRSGADKRGYTSPDGAEYAASAGLSMSWTTFLHSTDVWVAVTHSGLNRSRLAQPSSVVLRPRRAAEGLESRWLDGATFAVRIPHRPGGLRVSVEFESELFDTFNDCTSCCNLTDQRVPGHSFVHRQPRHAMLIFAEPMLTATEAPRLDPLLDPTVNGSTGSSGIAFAPTGDIRAFVHAATKPVMYFKPGVYYMGPSSSAVLRNAVRWVHLAPGAFVKGAFTFWGSGEGVSEYKLTGFGVLSGEQYVWSADPAHNYTHTSGGYGQLKMVQLQCNAGCAAMTIHGITMSEPPFYSMVIYGDADPSLGLAVDVARYKQVGAWYWETNGIELGSQGGGAWGWGKVEDSFMHCNDDCLILWHANNTATDVTIWHGTNGANIQLGWVPRMLTNVSVDGVDIIHNLMGWSDDKGNNGVINAAPLIPGFAVNPTFELGDFVLRNIVSEGATLCALRLAVEMTYRSLVVENLAIDEWNQLGPAAQRSSFYQADPQRFITPARGALVLENYTVGGALITRAANNWQAAAAGRLNFSADMWPYWDAK
jgi:hypothetical protein